MYLFFDEYEWPLCEWGDESSKPPFDSKDGNVATEEKQHKDPLTRHLQITDNSVEVCELEFGLKFTSEAVSQFGLLEMLLTLVKRPSTSLQAPEEVKSKNINGLESWFSARFYAPRPPIFKVKVLN